jgi:hypothetical protein
MAAIINDGCYESTSSFEDVIGAVQQGRLAMRSGDEIEADSQRQCLGDTHKAPAIHVLSIVTYRTGVHYSIGDLAAPVCL